MSDLSEKIAGIITAIAAAGSWISSYINKKKIEQVHVLLNSRLTKLLKLTQERSFKKGQESEKDKRGRSR